MTGTIEQQITTLLRAPRDEAAYWGLYQSLRAARSGPAALPPLVSQRALRIALVTATDSKYLPFFRRLLGSIPPALRRDHLDLCVLDVGLADEDARAVGDQVTRLVKPGWDIEFPGVSEAPVHLQAMIARPHVPSHFPGYHVYLWIDADAWVQSIACLDDLVLPALSGALSIVPVISPAYKTSFKLNKGPTISAVEWGRRALQMYFGDRLNNTRGDEPILNSGVFALRADAPHWALWSEALRHGNARGPGEFFVEQTALNYAVYENDLACHFLPATYNWQSHLSPPLYDSRSGLLCEPHLPHAPIKIVHLTGPDKAEPKLIRFLDGHKARRSLAEPLPRDRSGAADRPERDGGGEDPVARAPGQAARADAKSPVVTLPHFTKAGIDSGRRLKIRTHDRPETVSKFLRIQGVWQRDVSVFIDSVLSAGDVFVDLGANIGYFSVIAAAAVGPSGRVHAFEPEPTNLKLLRANQALNGLGNLVCHQVAIGEKSGRATLYRSRGNLGAHSLLKEDGLADPLEVRLATLDEALAEESGAIRLIKIDLQGADLLALRGMAGLLARQAVKPMIIFEYASQSFVDQDPGLEEFEGFVSRHGYHLHGFVTNTGASPIPPRLDFEAFRALHDSFVRHGPAVEIDLLLSAGTPEVKR